MARLSTHVLDTSRGLPASGVTIDLHGIVGGERRHVVTAATNPDGRMVPEDGLPPGVYELTFHVGDYFRAAGIALTEPPFFDEVVVRFGIADADGRFHVPLLIAPYGYSTYRGS